MGAADPRYATATVYLAGEPGPLDLTAKAARVLAESAALMTVRVPKIPSALVKRHGRIGGGVRRADRVCGYADR